MLLLSRYINGETLDLPGRPWRFESPAMFRRRTKRRIVRLRKALSRRQRRRDRSARLPRVCVEWSDWSSDGRRDLQTMIDALRVCVIEELRIHLPPPSASSSRRPTDAASAKVTALTQLVQLATQRLSLPPDWKDDLNNEQVEQVVSTLKASPYYHDLVITVRGTDMEVLRTFCPGKMRGSLVFHMSNDIMSQLIYLLRHGHLQSIRMMTEGRPLFNPTLQFELEDALADNTTIRSLLLGVRHADINDALTHSVFCALTRNRTLTRLEMDTPVHHTAGLVRSLPYMRGLREIVAPWPDVSSSQHPRARENLIRAVERNTSLETWDDDDASSTSGRRRPENNNKNKKKNKTTNVPQRVQTALRRNRQLHHVEKLRALTGAGALPRWVTHCDQASARFMLLGKYFTSQLETSS